MENRAKVLTVRVITLLFIWQAVFCASPGKKSYAQETAEEGKPDKKITNGEKSKDADNQKKDAKAVKEKKGSENEKRQRKESGLRIKVTDSKKKPISGAQVYVKSDEENFEFEKTRRTDPQGEATFEGVPWGRVHILVTAKDFPTFGDWYKLENKEIKIGITLKKATE
ncbi:MAG: carboxypeptidase regulatory-like domain-containing protein [Deltaproteobacteria bacterium]|nr:carboxypeptidase regulatory-like domain-containing protein [Deltaproteobacteria bacterium]